MKLFKNKNLNKNLVKTVKNACKSNSFTSLKYSHISKNIINTTIHPSKHAQFSQIKSEIDDIYSDKAFIGVNLSPAFKIVLEKDFGIDDLVKLAPSDITFSVTCQDKKKKCCRCNGMPEAICRRSNISCC